jgi:Ca2+-binding RTX toxin-like protein
MNKVQIQSGTMSVNADDAETTYIVGKAVTLDTTGISVHLNGEAMYRVLQVNGSIDSDYEGVRIDAQEAPFGGAKLLIGETGQVHGDQDGISIYGQGHLVSNAGTISGDIGIYTLGTNRIVNTGTIDGGGYGIDAHIGNGQGINLIVNKGTISGGTMAIQTSAEYDRVVNSGTINGNVDLGSADDTFVFKAGTVNGSVAGELGDDLYVVNKAGLSIVEDFNEGIDRINSSVTITMPANVEKLYLTGKAAIDATGSTGGNWIYGNRAANHIDAGGGFDYLDGGRGNDVLTGGSSSDDFHFARGSGKDIVTDFEAGFDEIQLGDLKGATDFTDMLANHVTEKGGDVWITYGQDIVVLKDTVAADLKGGDFDFG